MENTNLTQRLSQLCDTLVKKYYTMYPTSTKLIDFEIIQGKSYYKIMEVNNGGRSVHAFVSIANGDMYKPASYKGPAKWVRYKLLDDTSFETCLHNADPHGSYLYMK